MLLTGGGLDSASGAGRRRLGNSEWPTMGDWPRTASLIWSVFLTGGPRENFVCQIVRVFLWFVSKFIRRCMGVLQMLYFLQFRVVGNRPSVLIDQPTLTPPRLSQEKPNASVSPTTTCWTVLPQQPLVGAPFNMYPIAQAAPGGAGRMAATRKRWRRRRPGVALSMSGGGGRR